MLDCVALTVYCKQVFKKELAAKNAEKNIASQDEIESLFPKVDSIVKLHEDFILPELEARCNFSK